MTTKLTLRLNKNLIQQAKIFANTQNTSLSMMVADYFQKLIAIGRSKISTPILSEITGILKGKDKGNLYYRSLYRKHLQDKYLKK